MTAADVRTGDRIRLESGAEMLVSRIEPRLLGLEQLMAFVEDTPDPWFKQALAPSADVEVLRGS